jgi:hypothetical protein
MANEFQRAVLQGYPHVNLLPIDTADETAVDAAVAGRATADPLFEFLWSELSDAEDAESALVTLLQASRDIDAVLRHVRDAAPSRKP